MADIDGDLFVGRMEAALTDVTVGGLEYSKDLRVSASLEGDTELVSAAIAQLRGYLDYDEEPFIPVRWACLPDLDGYYRLTDLSISRDEDGAGADFGMTLEPIKGFAAPQFEATLRGARRNTGDLVAPAVQYWHALPEIVRGYETGTTTPAIWGMASDLYAPGISGRVSVFVGSVLSRTTSRYYLPPVHWYAGSPRLTVDGRLVVGSEVRNRPGHWVLQNTAMRLTGRPDGSIVMERWSGSGWAPPQSPISVWRLGRLPDGGTSWAEADALTDPHSLTVLHNNPDEVAIRLSYDAASLVRGSRFVVDVDIALKRGSATAVVTLETRGNYRWALATPILGAVKAPNDHYITGSNMLASLGTGRSMLPVSGGPQSVVAHNVSTQRAQWAMGVLPPGWNWARVYSQYMSAMYCGVQAVLR